MYKNRHCLFFVAKYSCERSGVFATKKKPVETSYGYY